MLKSIIRLEGKQTLFRTEEKSLTPVFILTVATQSKKFDAVNGQVIGGVAIDAMDIEMTIEDLDNLAGFIEEAKASMVELTESMGGGEQVEIEEVN